jgi:hypothetical protein
MRASRSTDWAEEPHDAGTWPAAEPMPPDRIPVRQTAADREWRDVTLNDTTVSVRIEHHEPARTASGHGAVVCLGAVGREFLMMDLAKAPGAIAVGGDPETAARLAVHVVDQLTEVASQGEVRVSVVGPLAQEIEPSSRLERLNSLAQLTPDPVDDTAVHVIVWAAPCAMHVSTVDFLLDGSGANVVPLVVGEVPDAPWRITVQPGQSRASHEWPSAVDDGLAAVLHDLSTVLTAHRLPAQAVDMVGAEARALIGDTLVMDGEQAAQRLSQAMPPALRQLIEAGVLDRFMAARMDAVTIALCVSHVVRDVGQTIAEHDITDGPVAVRKYMSAPLPPRPALTPGAVPASFDRSEPARPDSASVHDGQDAGLLTPAAHSRRDGASGGGPSI